MKKATLPTLALLLAIITCSAVTRSKKAEISRNLDTFNALYRELQTFYVDSIDAQKSIETAIGAMLNGIDPYTEYFPKKEQDMFRVAMAGEYGGIGALIMQRDKNSGTFIEQPYSGSPAAEVGLRPGDHIIMIDEDSVSSLPTAKVSEKLRGPAGSALKVMVNRPYVADSILTFDLTRRKIQLPAVTYYGKVGKNTGYIALNTFNEKSFQEVKEALNDLMKNQGVSDLILDLRGNGGGLVEEAVQILGLFLPKGTQVLTTKGQNPTDIKVYKTSNQPLAPKIPLVVLIDGESASASEITAGALQDLDRAVIVGNRSFGKGLVQTTRSLPNEGMLKVTVAKYYIPSGRLIQAVDYSHRNAQGEATRIPDSLTTVFKTVAGRDVRDGGGITPDVMVKYPDVTRLTYNAVMGNWIFDFANQFRAKNEKAPELDSFEVTDEIYTDFKKSINPDKFNYDKVCETILKQLSDAAKVEGYMNDSIQGQIDALGKLLHHDLDQDLDVNRKMLEPYIGAEIMERYYSEKGAAKYHLRHDIVLDKALELISQGQLNSLLSPAK